jgi:hypothetical protein
MKILVCAVLLCFAANSPVKPDRHSTQSNAASEAKREPPVVIFNNEKSSALQNENGDKAPKWYASVEWANWALVLVGLATAFAIWAQTVATREATDKVGETLDIQRAAMRQWIDVETGEIMAPVTGDNVVEFYFQAINNTSYPLTIRKVVTKVSVRANEWETHTVNTNAILPPKGGEKIYPFYITVNASDILPDWVKGTVLTINGEIAFVDCLNENRVQQFGGLYACSASGFEYLRPLGLAPDRKTEKADQNPN